MLADGDYGPNTAFAWNACPEGATVTGSHPNRICYGQLVRYNLHYGTAWDSDLERKSTACHEVGHAVALQHTDDTSTCMKGNYPLQTTQLSPHEKSLINNRYK